LAGNIGSTLGDAASALGALGSDEPATSSEIGPDAILNGAWIDYTLILPDGSEKTQRRILWERDESEDLSTPDIPSATDIVVDPLEAGPALTVQNTWMTAVGAIPPGYRLDRTIEDWLQARPLIEAAVMGEIDPQAAAQALDELPPPKSTWSNHLTMFAFFDELPSDAGRVRYRSEPLLVQHQQWIGDGLRMGVDIVFNAQRAYQVSRSRVRLDAEAALRAGVWETVTEGLVLPGDVASARSTQAFFAAAADQALPLRVFAPGESGELFDLPLNDSQALRAIQRDLDAGYAVVVPQFMPDGFEYAGWWRIDPQTGEALGMIDSGAGSSMTEYMLIFSQGVAGFTCFGISAADSNGLTFKDYLTCTLASFVGIAAVGGGLIVGAKLGAVIVAAVVGALNSIRAGVGNNSSL
jgi:hypothetical protein